MLTGQKKSFTYDKKNRFTCAESDTLMPPPDGCVTTSGVETGCGVCFRLGTCLASPDPDEDLLLRAASASSMMFMLKSSCTTFFKNFGCCER